MIFDSNFGPPVDAPIMTTFLLLGSEAIFDVLSITTLSLPASFRIRLPACLPGFLMAEVIFLILLSNLLNLSLERI